MSNSTEKTIFCHITPADFFPPEGRSVWISDEANELEAAACSAKLTEAQEQAFADWDSQIDEWLNKGFEVLIENMVEELESQGHYVLVGDDQELNRLVRGNGMHFDEVYDGSGYADPVAFTLESEFPFENEPAIPESLRHLLSN